MDEIPNKAAKYEFLFEKWQLIVPAVSNWTFQDWLKTFSHIFGNSIHLQTLESLGFHFLEEAGEEAYAIRKLMQLEGLPQAKIKNLEPEYFLKLTTIEGIVKEYKGMGVGSPDGKPVIDLKSRRWRSLKARIVDAKMDLVIELADTFSWFCSILIKLGYTIKNLADNGDAEANIFNSNLEDRLVALYDGKPSESLTCPECKAQTCECAFFPRYYAIADTGEELKAKPKQ
jgi:hypothetical protein